MRIGPARHHQAGKPAGRKVGKQENRHTGESAMIIGVPKEIKDNEARVAVTPAGVKALTEHGHTVLVETEAGAQSGFDDAEYQNAGAEIVGDAGYAWGKADMVVKVKEPIESEYVYFRDGLVLFTYLHLAPLPGLTDEAAQEKGYRHCL
jgi:alanine dehydrogenase